LLIDLGPWPQIAHRATGPSVAGPSFGRHVTRPPLADPVAGPGHRVTGPLLADPVARPGHRVTGPGHRVTGPPLAELAA